VDPDDHSAVLAQAVVMCLSGQPVASFSIDGEGVDHPESLQSGEGSVDRGDVRGAWPEAVADGCRAEMVQFLSQQPSDLHGGCA